MALFLLVFPMNEAQREGHIDEVKFMDNEVNHKLGKRLRVWLLAPGENFPKVKTVNQNHQLPGIACGYLRAGPLCVDNVYRY